MKQNKNMGGNWYFAASDENYQQEEDTATNPISGDI